VTYAVRLGFVWDEEFEKALKAARRAQAFKALSGDRMRREMEKIFLEGYWDLALGLAAELELFGDVLPGWKVPLLPSKKKTSGESELALVDAARAVDARPKPEEIWRRLLEPLPRPERDAAASRLNFSKALRRAAGVEPR
jgi:tRNA nucleotidyltransferase/poly(A) polymerase